MPNNDYILRSDALKAILGVSIYDTIEELEGARTIAENTWADGLWDAYKIIEEEVDAADVEPKQKWIPVTERLPECEVGAEIGNVEWISHDRVFAGCFGRGGKYRDAYFRTWTDTTEGIDAKDADCWRVVTLPEPPGEVDDGHMDV
jgi:hypothetical protein